MEVISIIVGILSLCVGVLAFGYQIGKDSRGENHDKHKAEK